jgi:hypothetical protein
MPLERHEPVALAMVKSLAVTRSIIFVASVVVSVFGSYVYGSVANVVFLYVILDGMFSLFFVSRVLSGGRTYIVAYVLMNVIWVTGAWLLAPSAARFVRAWV